MGAFVVTGSTFCASHQIYIIRRRRYNGYMKTLKYIILMFAAIVLISPSLASADQASLSVSSLSADAVQVVAIGGSPNAAVYLHYISNSTIKTIKIGTTDSRGYLTTTVSSGDYHIMGGVQVYAIIDGQQSTTVIWPNYANSGVLSLNPASLSMAVGQTSVVAASVGSNLSVVDNLNSSVASISLNGSQISVTGNIIGATNIIICAKNVGCNTLYVSVGTGGSQTNTTSNTVTSSSQVVQSAVTNMSQIVQAAISFAQASTTLNVGQGQTIHIDGSGAFGISGNSNIRAAIANLSGPAMYVKALSTGSTTINVCAVGDSSSVTCSGFLVNVVQPQDSSISSSSPNVVLSTKNVTLDIGQSRIITISGSGSYYLSQNSGSNSVSANVSGNTLTVAGMAFGGSNVTVCQQTVQCDTVYVYVNAAPLNGTNTTGVVKVSSNSNSSSSYFNRYLYQGMTAQGVADPDVTALQKLLAAKGLYSGPITGYFGPLTKVAVQTYQKKNGLKQLGVVGPSTRVLLNKEK